MQHIGTLFLAKRKPETGRADDGAFTLTLSLIDNLGDGRKEQYRARWTGPDAQAFWQAHENDLQPGAILRAELSHVCIHSGATYPNVPELRARIVSLEYRPKAQPMPPAQSHNPYRAATA